MAVHEYTSTACLHDQHARCRRVCEFCPAACDCRCHDPVRLADMPSSALASWIADGY